MSAAVGWEAPNSAGGGWEEAKRLLGFERRTDDDDVFYNYILKSSTNYNKPIFPTSFVRRSGDAVRQRELVTKTA